MTRAMPAVTAPAADEPDPPAQPPAPRSAPLHRVAACSALTLAALAIVLVGPAAARSWPVAALCALVVGGGGLPLHRAAWAALRRGAATADVLPAAGVLVTFAAAVTAPTAPVLFVIAAAVTSLLLTGRVGAARVAHAAAPVPASTPDPLPAATHGDAPPAPSTTAAAQARRAAVALERVTERAAGGFACVVAALAVATLGFWLGAGAGPAASLGAAAAVLLVACPRVVGTAAATALLTATGRATALGAVPGTARTLERAARVDTVVLCRTGTVTTGARELHAVHPATDVDPDEALRLAGAVAVAARDHGGTAGGYPIGAVLAREARARFGVLPGVAEFDGYPGLGVRGVVTEVRPDPDDEPRVIAHATLVGRTALLAEHGIALPPELAEAVEQAHAAGRTAVAVSWDGVARAVLEVADPVRPGTAEAVRRLRGLGIVPVLLTGDDAGAARGLAAVLGVDPGQVLAPVARHDRAAAIAALRAQGRTVAVPGGPDDVPALAAADVALVRPAGPAVGSGFALRDDDPLTAVDALHLARRTVRTVQRGITAAATYHLVALPVAAAGLLPPLAAGALAAAYPVAALAHAAALRRVRPAPRSGEGSPS
jgi:P-type Cu+ transporter